MEQQTPLPPHQPRPQVVHVVSKPGGFTRAVFFVLGIFLFAAVFGAGLLFGIAGVVATTSLEESVVRRSWREGDSRTIGIIPITGTIDDSMSMFMRAAVDHVIKDSDIRAVVLRVDSPGGGVAASDQIWHEVERLKARGLPVVASCGGVAASGGYYVSCGADEIVAEETCITGSIGVIAQVLTLQGLMEKVGVEPVTLVAHGSPEKHVGNDILRSWTEADKAKVQTMLDAAHAIFTKRVKDGRKKAVAGSDMIDQLADGSIYTAQQALSGGLIDSIGYLDDAIARAEALASVPAGRSSVVVIDSPPSLFGEALTMSRRSGASQMPMNADSLRSLVSDLACPRIMYLMR